MLFKFASKELPTKELRELQYCLVRGAMGVGKTTTTYRAVTSVCSKLPACMPCYVRLDTFQDRLRMNSTEDEIDPAMLLASALLYGFSHRQLAVYGPSLHEMTGKIGDDLGVVKVILHLDEFQSHPILAKKIMSGCKLSLLGDSLSFCVVPILSGVNDLNQIAEPMNPSNWSGDEVQLGPLPMDELEKHFADALDIKWDVYSDCMHLRTIFKDCGGYVHQVIRVLESIQARHDVHAGLKSGNFGAASAEAVFQDCLGRLQSVFGAQRWHALFTSKTPPPGTESEARSRPSLRTSTVTVLTKIIFAVFSKYPVDKNAVMLELKTGGSVRQIQWITCRDLGTVDLRLCPDGNGTYTVEASLMSLLVMNRVANMEPIPEHLGIENPFREGWQTLEKVAMVSLMSQLRARDSLQTVRRFVCRFHHRILTEQKMNITALRPGANFQSKYALEIINPEGVVFSVLTTHLESPDLKTTNGGTCQLNPGDVIVAADRQKGCDGLLIVDGRILLGRKKPQKTAIIWISQSKKQETSGMTGLPSGSTLFDGTIETEILPKMREVAKAFKRKYSKFKKAFVVYDVFSDRHGPKKGNASFQLDDKEAIFVTRSGNLDSVLGGLSARKRPILT